MKRALAVVALMAAASGCLQATERPGSSPTSSLEATTVPPSSETTATTAAEGGSTTTPPITTAVPITTMPPATTTMPEALPQPIVPTGSAAVDLALFELARFVETTRGLPFLEPIRVRLVDDEEFEDAVVSSFTDDGFVEALEAHGRLLEVLELIPEGTDYVGIVRVSMRDGIIGFYDPVTGELYVRGTEMTPFVRTTVVHELTHALDDQWFDLDGSDVADDEDRTFALTALAEGSSQAVEQVYFDGLSGADVSAFHEELAAFLSAMEDPKAPPALYELGENVYSLGQRFVAALRLGDAETSLDQAFRDPPVSTEQLLHPRKYAGHEAVVPVEVPAFDGELLATGTVGEQALVELLNAELTPAQARLAAEGWGGDRYVLYSAAGRDCARIDLAMDDPDDADELERALRSWGRRQRSAIIERPALDVVRVTACTA